MRKIKQTGKEKRKKRKKKKKKTFQFINNDVSHGEIKSQKSLIFE